jgi:hypothetical protein
MGQDGIFKKICISRDGMGDLKELSFHKMERASNSAVPSHPMGQNVVKNVP